MDVIGTLTAMGNYFNNKQEPPSDRSNTNDIKRTRINGQNIYDSNELSKNKKIVKKIANDRYYDARSPMESGVVPNIYNQISAIEKQKSDNLKLAKNYGLLDNDSVFSDYSDDKSLKSNGSLEFDHTALFKKSNLLRDNNRNVEKFRAVSNKSKGSYLDQFGDLSFDNPDDPVSANNTSNNINRINTERELALSGGYSSFQNNSDMTYGVIRDEDFAHNNMVPFFRNGAGKGYGADSIEQRQWDDTMQRKMELFSGSSKSVDYRPKTERRPLFNPIVGLTNIYGMPNTTDYMESRYIPSRFRNNEKPFQEVRITPGLNLAYNAISQQGYEEAWRNLPKDTNELRPANKPKVSYGGVIIPGQKGDRRSIIPNVAKHRPEKFKENDPRDMLKSIGDIRGPTIYGNFDVQPTNRQMTSRAWYSSAKADSTTHLPSGMYEKVKVPFRENFLTDAPRNVTGVNQEKNTSNTSGSYHVKETNRVTTQNNTYVAPATTEWKKGYAFDKQDAIPDPTMRDIHNLVTQLNPVSTDYNKGPAFDMFTNRPDTTLKELIENNTNVQNINTEYKKGYAFDMFTNRPDTTLKELIENNTNIDNINTEWKKGYAFDMFTNRPDTTLKELIENNTNLNNVGPEWKKGYAFDMKTNIPDTTLKELIENNTNLNNVGPEWKKGYAFDMKTNIPDTTLKELIENNTNLNNVGPEWKKGYAFDMKTNIPDPTLRNLTEVNGYIGTAGFPEREKGGYQAEQAGTIAPPTLRQLTQNNTYVAPTVFHEGLKYRTREDAVNSYVNAGKDKTTVIRDGGAPTPCNYEKGPTYEGTMVQLCEPIQINRDVYANMSGQRPLQCVPTMYTRVGHSLPEQSWRFDTCVVSNLNTNPYVNNTQHKSVDY